MKKRKKQIIVLAVTAVLAGLIVVYKISSYGDKEITQFERPGYGQEKDVHEVDAVIGESRYSIEVEFRPGRYRTMSYSRHLTKHMNMYFRILKVIMSHWIILPEI